MNRAVMNNCNCGKKSPLLAPAQLQIKQYNKTQMTWDIQLNWEFKYGGGSYFTAKPSTGRNVMMRSPSHKLSCQAALCPGRCIEMLMANGLASRYTCTYTHRYVYVNMYTNTNMACNGPLCGHPGGNMLYIASGKEAECCICLVCLLTWGNHSHRPIYNIHHIYTICNSSFLCFWITTASLK